MRRSTWIVALALSFMSAVPAVSVPRLAVEPGRLAPYAFGEATITSDGGLSGLVRVQGLDSSGASVNLFEARIGRLRRLRVRFYVDTSLAELRFTCSDGTGAPLAATIPVDLAVDPATEALGDEAGAALKALGFPLREPLALASPRALAFDAGEPYDRAAKAQRLLFTPGRPRGAIIALAAWSAMAVASAFMQSRRARLALGLVAIVFAVGLCLGVTAFHPAGDLFVIDLAPSQEAFAVEPARSDMGGYRLSLWTAPTQGVPSWSLSFLGLRSPLRPTIPLAAFSEYAGLRFQTPPTVTLGNKGEALLAASAYQSAWAMKPHGGRAR